MDALTLQRPDVLKELHRDLARKYRIHGARFEQIWRSFDTTQRAEVLRAGAANGVVLKSSTDRDLGDAYKIIPEFNLRSIAGPDSDYLLDILKHRATQSLQQQYCIGINGGPGDAEFISSMLVTNLRNVNSFPQCYTLFYDEEKYGQSYFFKYPPETLAGLSIAVDAGLCVPQSTGELILERQIYALQLLNILVEDILDGGSISKNADTRSMKPEEAARTALSKLSIIPKQQKLSMQELIATALDQNSSLNDYLNLSCTEPVFLAHAVNIWFFTRP